MAKVTFAPDIASISGKLCSQNGTIYAVNKRTGKTYRTERHTFTDANTQAQQTARATFKKRTQTASAWWNANKPTKENTLGTEAYQKVIKAYKQQRKIGNAYAFLNSLITADLKVILAGTDITNGITAGGTSSSTSGTNPGGGSAQED